MSRERLYGWNGELPAKSPSGQKQIVLKGLRDHKDELHTGHEWADIIGPSLATSQDAYRVVLYYIIILKGDGCIRTDEFDINATTRTETGKHGVTVKVSGRVEERTPPAVTVPVKPVAETEQPVNVDCELPSDEPTEVSA